PWPRRTNRWLPWQRLSLRACPSSFMPKARRRLSTDLWKTRYFLGAHDGAGELVDQVGEVAETTLPHLGGVQHHHRGVVGDPRAVPALRQLRAVPAAEDRGRVLTELHGELPHSQGEVVLRRAEGGPLPVDQRDLTGLVDHELVRRGPGVDRHRVGGQRWLDLHGALQDPAVHLEAAAVALQPLQGGAEVALDVVGIDAHL